MTQEIRVSKPIITTITHDAELLAPYLEMFPQGAELLPKQPREVVSFDMHGAYVELANGLRRTLIEEIPVICLHVEEQDVETDDEFIMLHLLQRGINMLAINQHVNHTAVNDMRLSITNNTAEVLCVTAADLLGGSKVIVHKHVPIINLRPGCSLKIGRFSIQQGMGKDDMQRFSFLNNVSYSIRGVEHYNNLTKRGKRAIEYDPDTFTMSYETCGTCDALYPIKLACESMIARLKKISTILNGHDPEMQLTVTAHDSYHEYKIMGFYITEANMIAKQCYRLDPNIEFVSGGVQRFDSQICNVKIKHAEHLAILKKAVEKAIRDVEHTGAQLLK